MVRDIKTLKFKKSNISFSLFSESDFHSIIWGSLQAKKKYISLRRERFFVNLDAILGFSSDRKSLSTGQTEYSRQQ